MHRLVSYIYRNCKGKCGTWLFHTSSKFNTTTAFTACVYIINRKNKRGYRHDKLGQRRFNQSYDSTAIFYNNKKTSYKQNGREIRP